MRPTAEITEYTVVFRVSSVSSGDVSSGSYPMAGPWPGLRAALNARLEEVSFRTGVTALAVLLRGLKHVALRAEATPLRQQRVQR